MIIQYLPTPTLQLESSGWIGPGYYFWDESQSVCYGPYSTEEEANKCAADYADRLSKMGLYLKELEGKYCSVYEGHAVSWLMAFAYEDWPESRVFLEACGEVDKLRRELEELNKKYKELAGKETAKL